MGHDIAGLRLDRDWRPNAVWCIVAVALSKVFGITAAKETLSPTFPLVRSQLIPENIHGWHEVILWMAIMDDNLLAK